MSSDSQSEESDIELKSKLPKVSKMKIPKSPSEHLLVKTQGIKKLTTKMMINQALIDLRSRKGTSLYAIKKYIAERYDTDTDKLNYYIKKYIRTAVEQGSIVQTKGIGASGSFRLVPVKQNNKKPKKIDKEKVTKKEKPEKMKKTKEKETKPPKKKEKSEKTTKKPKSKEKKLSETENKPKKLKKKPSEREVKPKPKTAVREGKASKKKVTIAKGMQTPAKSKASMVKRKSIGSIIKPPRMKPKKL